MSGSDDFLKMKLYNLKSKVNGDALSRYFEDQLDLLDDEQLDKLPIRQFCAKLPIPLLEEMEKVCEEIDCTRRLFVQNAIIWALERYNQLLDEVNPYESLDKVSHD